MLLVGTVTVSISNVARFYKQHGTITLRGRAGVLRSSNQSVVTLVAYPEPVEVKE